MAKISKETIRQMIIDGNTEEDIVKNLSAGAITVGFTLPGTMTKDKENGLLLPAEDGHSHEIVTKADKAAMEEYAMADENIFSKPLNKEKVSLPDGEYQALWYGYTMEIEGGEFSGEKFSTRTSVRCTREHCGKSNTIIVKDKNVLIKKIEQRRTNMENIVKALLEEGFNEELTSKMAFDILEGKVDLKPIEADSEPKQISLDELEAKPARGVTEATKPYWHRAIQILKSQSARTSTYGAATAIMNNVMKHVLKEVEEGKVAVAMLSNDDDKQLLVETIDILTDEKTLDSKHHDFLIKLLTDYEGKIEAVAKIEAKTNTERMKDLKDDAERLKIKVGAYSKSWEEQKAGGFSNFAEDMKKIMKELIERLNAGVWLAEKSDQRGQVTK